MATYTDRENLGKSRKPTYTAPRLARFGSVRTLTGGSSGMAADGGGGMTMM